MYDWYVIPSGPWNVPCDDKGQISWVLLVSDIAISIRLKVLHTDPVKCMHAYRYMHVYTIVYDRIYTGGRYTADSRLISMFNIYSHLLTFYWFLPFNIKI